MAISYYTVGNVSIIHRYLMDRCGYGVEAAIEGNYYLVYAQVCHVIVC